MKLWPGLSILAFVPAAACAHVFAQPYILPVPFSLYAFGATAALLLSFVVVGVFAAMPLRVLAPTAGAATGHEGEHNGQCEDARPPVKPALALALAAGRFASVGALAICIVTGLAGSQNVFVNLNMTLFWIVFVLGVPYAVALAGDFYAPINPWRALVDWLEEATARSFAGRLRNPARFGYVPALALYMAFIWLELFGQLLPRGLSIALAAYTLVNLAGAFVFGKQAWFRYGEFFGVFLRLLGRMSPNARRWGADDGIPAGAAARRWRPPFVGLLEEPVTDMSLVLFILFMLSSTAFDGLHSTLPWVTVYWKQIYPAIAPWLPATPGARSQFLVSTQVYYVWQWASLLVSPFLYLAVFGGFVGAVKALTRSSLPLRVLVMRFALSLVPIAFVYHVTHYYTLLLAQGGQVVRLVSDPLGIGWNVFGTARATIAPWMIGMGTIWLTQLGLILTGHIVGVYLAHIEALRLVRTPRCAAVSQLPMLVLMVVFTNFGLWILSLPIAGGG